MVAAKGGIDVGRDDFGVIRSIEFLWQLYEEDLLVLSRSRRHLHFAERGASYDDPDPLRQIFEERLRFAVPILTGGSARSDFEKE